MRFLVRETVDHVVEGDPMTMTPSIIRKQIDKSAPMSEDIHFLINGKVADDDKPISDHMRGTEGVFSNGSSLQMTHTAFLDFELDFDFNGSKEQIGVSWKDSFDIVKRKIEKKFGVTTRVQHWCVNSRWIKDDEILLDVLTASPCVVELRIIFAANFSVLVKWIYPSQTQKIRCGVGTTVEELKGMLEAPVGPFTGDHQLVYYGKRLKDSQVLWDCNIRNESTIYLIKIIR